MSIQQPRQQRQRQRQQRQRQKRRGRAPFGNGSDDRAAAAAAAAAATAVTSKSTALLIPSSSSSAAAAAAAAAASYSFIFLIFIVIIGGGCSSSFGVGLSVSASGAAAHIDDDYIYFRVHDDPKLERYVFRGLTAKDFGGVFTARYERIPLVVAQPLDACTPISAFGNMVPPPQNEAMAAAAATTIKAKAVVKDSIVLIKRGTCAFAEKAAHAEAAGAKVAMIFADDPTNEAEWIDMILDGLDAVVNIPVLFLLGRDGYHLIESLKQSQEERGRVGLPTSIPLNASSFLTHEMTPWTQW